MKGARIVMLVASFAIALGVSASSALASSWVYAVNTTTDESLSENAEACDAELGTAKSEKCSLREALEAAHNTATYGADGIEVFVPKGLYELSKGTLPLGTESKCFEGATCPVLLKGEGAGSTTIDGGKASTLVKTTFGAAGTTIEGLTLQNGRAELGGAVYNEFKVSLTIRDSVISENVALKDGGGIYSIGYVDVFDSRISKNRAGTNGGGVSEANFGWTFVRSGVLENVALKAGGGLDVSHSVGSIVDSTVALNESPEASAVYASGGSAGVHYSTLADNDGAAAAIEAPGGLVELESSIVSGNATSQCANVAKAQAVDVNIVHGEDACAFSGPAPLNVDPKLGGGLAAGLGEGLALLAGSPAVNAGGATCAAAQADAPAPVDQRGLARPQGAACDLGAIEAGADASVGLVASPDPVAPAGTLALTATSSDAGAEAATATTVTLSVPAGAAFASAPPGCLLATGPPATVTCSVGTLMPGQSHQTTIMVRPERPGALIETATVTHAEADFDTANDNVTIASSVVSPGGQGTGGPSPGGPGAGLGAGRAGSTLVGRTIAVDAHGNATVKLRCVASATGGCQDAVALYAGTGSMPAVAAARRAALLGRAHVHVAAGRTASVRIHLSAGARARLSGAHPSLHARLLLSARNAVSPASSHTYAVTLVRARRRRRV